MDKINIGLRNQKQSPKEVIDIIKDKKNIPFDMYIKYYEKYNCSHKVEFNCNLCNNIEITAWNTLSNRIKLYNKICCKKCSYILSTCQREGVPDELVKYYINNDNIDFKTYLKYKNYNCNKLNIKLYCDVCKKEKIVKWSKIKYRTHSNDKPICSDCAHKYGCSTHEARLNNSKAQKIAQNKIETIKKNRNSQLKRFKNLDNLNKHREMIKNLYTGDYLKKVKLIQSERSKILWQDEKFREKCTNVTTLSGKYKNIKFDSSWELSYIIYYYGRIKRCNLSIPYVFKNKHHRYYPDFILDDKYIIEIKGRKDEINDIKKDFAIKYINDNNLNFEYKILYKEDLIKIQNFIFYDSLSKVNEINKNDIIIYHKPKNWNL